MRTIPDLRDASVDGIKLDREFRTIISPLLESCQASVEELGHGRQPRVLQRVEPRCSE
jgi:hypothetical protein